ncbi:transporter [Veronia nyctiphanis]|uniref:Transporter n=1 Tax=Veronia nyctiphanis TaxID=1278244 RepID=A0A4Q0YU95_9GAMM|nr:VF530 family protein [Veronia nyctiphanis]RXJ72769.1 transporter [Veronia nyctiphanis]
MAGEQRNNPMHGIKLEKIVTDLVDHYGWQILGEKIKINCFRSEPSVKSSLKFLRRTQWARDEVELLYKETFIEQRTSINPWDNLKPQD